MNSPIKAIVSAISLGLVLAVSLSNISAAEKESLSLPIDMTRWEERIFKGSTRYRSVVLDDQRVLRAEAHGSASALYQEHDINLTQTPYVNWRWRVEEILDGAIDEQTKSILSKAVVWLFGAAKH